MSGFEGSFLGNAARLDPDSVLECGVCWWVYDPALGDDTWQIPAGTPFAELPAHWRCPACDAAAEQFMVLTAGREPRPERRRPTITESRRAVRQREQELRQAFAVVDERMRRLPVYNRALDIQVFGLQPWEAGMVGVVATPWCMNILLLPPEGDPQRLEGTSRDVTFPSGSYSFVAGELPGVGRVETCSLFSPMEQFDDPAVVTEVAHHALEALMTAPDSEGISRRRFLRGGKQHRDPVPAG